MLNTGEKVDLEGGNGSRSANAVILDLTHQIEKPYLDCFPVRIRKQFDFHWATKMGNGMKPTLL